MKNNMFTQFKKKDLAHTILGGFMVLSLLLQNFAYVPYAFAHENEVAPTEQATAPIVEETVTTQTEESTVVAPVTVTEEESSVVTEENDSDDNEKHHNKHSEKSEKHEGMESEEGTSSQSEGQGMSALRAVASGMNTAKPMVKIVATNVVCDSEAQLPNWGLGAADITSHTATDYVAAHAGCKLATDWKFQWGFSGVNDLSGSFVGEADGSKGPNTNTGSGSGDWKTFGPTDGSGVAMTTICDLEGSAKLWVREVLQEGYIPFTFDPLHQTNTNNVSAELYCHTDVVNYDNYDYINAPALGSTYYCVAFNVKKSVPHVNQAPVITVVGANPTSVTIGGTYTDLSATVADAEDGNITNKLVTTGSVNTAVIGTYTITYNATDSQSLAALPKTRTVNVVPKPTCTTQCPVNNAPVITIVGANPLTIIQNSVFTDPFATAFDLEDATITPTATGTVNTAVLGSYFITYNAHDSQGATATPKIRTVNVVPAAGCTTNCPATNTPPVITVIGANPLTVIQNALFTDPGATAFDLEDATITPSATGTVNTATLGSYLITYTAVDSKGATATPKTRTVTVVPAGTTPTNQKPEITLLGDVIMQLTVGTTFIDPSATVLDLEDGVITNKLVASGTVDINTIGSYTITYNATDSQSLAADTKTRTVNVVAAAVVPPPPPTGCTTNCGGGSSDSPYPGCMNPAATNYNSLANRDDGSCKFPGGGGGGSVPLSISNEKLVVSGTTSVTISWNTNLPSDSRVVYGDSSVVTLGAKPSYGYVLTTATDTTNVYNHSMVITGVPSMIATYFRPVSSKNAEIVTGIELTRTPDTTLVANSCEYLKEYLRLGANNNPTEVTKLQLFLKNYDGATNLAVTGFFDITTDQAVRSFQSKYGAEVLGTWDLTSNTGYVYYTTKKKINEIYCQHEFPLTMEQKDEIASFRALIQRINSSGGSSTEVAPLVGTNTQGSSGGAIAGASTVKTPVSITVTPNTGAANYAALNANAVKQGTDTKVDIEHRGRIAIADLLATAPSTAEGIAGKSSEVNETSDMGTGTDSGGVTRQNGKSKLLAGVINSFSDRVNQCSASTIYFALLFFVLALVFAALYLRKSTALELEKIEDKKEAKK